MLKIRRIVRNTWQHHARKAAVAAMFVATPVICAVPTEALGQSPQRIASRVERQTDPAHPLTPAIRVARSSLERLQNVEDYEGTFLKRERVENDFIVQGMNIKLREQPFSVYLRYHEPHDGREVMYIEGWNNGNLIAHDVGIRAIAGTVSLEPTGPRAMSENRYPVTQIGMRTLLQTLLLQWESETRLQGGQVQYYPEAKIGDLACKVIESRHSAPQPGLKFAITRLYLDAENGLPVRVQQYGFPAAGGDQPELIEEYTYLNMKYNVGLDEQDFNPRNPAYGF